MRQSTWHIYLNNSGAQGQMFDIKQVAKTDAAVVTASPRNH